MEQQQRRARNQAFCQTSPRCNGKFTEESLIEYLILASALETCEFNKVSELDFLLSKTALEGVLQMAGQKSTGLSAVTWCLPGINLSGSKRRGGPILQQSRARLQRSARHAEGPVSVEPCVQWRCRERPESLRVFGRLPATDVRACTEAGVRKASREAVEPDRWDGPQPRPAAGFEGLDNDH